MVIASHFTFACYGFWPPNDDRGSWSDVVWAKHLKPFGEPRKVSTRRSIAHVPHDQEKNRAIREALLYPVVKLTADQRDVVANAFAETIEMLRLTVHACAIMPDHVHLVAMRHHLLVEDLIGYLKRAATRALTRAAMHPLAGCVGPRGTIPTPWAHGGWKRFIDDASEIPGAIDYVVKNPSRARLAPQTFAFVRSYPV